MKTKLLFLGLVLAFLSCQKEEVITDGEVCTTCIHWKQKHNSPPPNEWNIGYKKFCGTKNQVETFEMIQEADHSGGNNPLYQYWWECTRD